MLSLSLSRRHELAVLKASAVLVVIHLVEENAQICAMPLFKLPFPRKANLSVEARAVSFRVGLEKRLAERGCVPPNYVGVVLRVVVESSSSNLEEETY